VRAGCHLVSGFFQAFPELMGGRIGVESEPGTGSRFWFTAVFDKQPEANSPLQPGLGAAEKIQANIESKPALGGRILVAEDNAVNQELMIAILDRMGLSADIAENGREVLDALSARHYDLVLMDCRMPEMDGYEATRLIRQGAAGDGNRAIPVIALTAHAMVTDREFCLAAGKTRESTTEFDLPAKPSPDRRFDIDSFLRRIDGNENLALKLARIFLNDMPIQIGNIKTAIAAGDIHEVSRLAHRIKGAAANMVCERLRAAAQSLEKSGKASEDTTAISRLISDLEYEFRFAAERLEHLSNQQS
jgi:two-component system, sensor histidine kinase